jgi:hypothetical protein
LKYRPLLGVTLRAEPREAAVSVRPLVNFDFAFKPFDSNGLHTGTFGQDMPIALGNTIGFKAYFGFCHSGFADDSEQHQRSKRNGQQAADMLAHATVPGYVPRRERCLHPAFNRRRARAPNMPFDSAHDPAVIDNVLRELRTADNLFTRAHLFRRSASLCWEVSWAANRKINEAADRGASIQELHALADEVNKDWRLITIATYQEAVALELCLKSIVAARAGYDEAEGWGHNLRPLIDGNAPMVISTPARDRLIWNLEQALIWQGRYPTPLARQITKGVHRRPSKRVSGKSNTAGEIFHEDRLLIDDVFSEVAAIAISQVSQSWDRLRCHRFEGKSLCHHGASVRGDPQAEMALRRAVIDRAPDPMNVEKFEAWLDGNDRSLRQVLDPTHLKALQDVLGAAKINNQLSRPTGAVDLPGSLADKGAKIFGVTLPSVMQRMLSAKQGRMSAKYGVADVGLRAVRAFSNREIENAWREALYKPKVAKDLQLMVKGGGVTPNQLFWERGAWRRVGRLRVDITPAYVSPMDFR